MAPRASISVPTAAALPHSHRLPTNTPIVFKTLIKLSRSSLLELVSLWLDDSNQTTCAPLLSHDEDGEDEVDEAQYLVAKSLQELREIYEELNSRKGGKREVVDRILEGDWRHGISLRQLAMADVRCLEDRATPQRWTAFQLTQMKLLDGMDSSDEDIRSFLSQDVMTTLPRYHAPTFLRNLQAELSPLVKAHYYLAKLPKLPMTIMRMYMQDSPYSSQRSLESKEIPVDGAKVIYVGFPAASPYIYFSQGRTSRSSAARESRSMQDLVLDALPKAFSRPRQRYTLKPTSLWAKSLGVLISQRGPGRSNACAGGWGIFADGSVEESPLNPICTDPRPLQSEEDRFSDQEDPVTTEVFDRGKQSMPAFQSHEHTGVSDDTTHSKRRKLLARTRFGTSAVDGDGKGIERLDIRIEDPFPASAAQINRINSPSNPLNETDTETPNTEHTTQPRRPRGRPRKSILDQNLLSPTPNPPAPGSTTWRPNVNIEFQGTHVVAGIRHLLELGVVDGTRMPGWMTGEEGVSVGAVRDGRITGRKGAGGL